MWSLSRIKASKHDPSVNAIFTISIQPELASEAYAYQKPPPFRPGGGFFKFRDVGRLSTENLAEAEELEASMDHAAPTLQSGSQQPSQGELCIRLKRQT
jgi:hypothetical protein